MHIVLKCPTCSANLKAPSKLAGKKLKCPKCATLLIVPAPQVAQVVEEQLEVVDPLDMPMPVTSTQTYAPQAQPTKPVGFGNKATKKKRGTSWVLIASIAAAMLLVCAGALFWVYSSTMANSPKGITLNDGSNTALSKFSGRKFQRNEGKPPEVNSFDKGNKEIRDPAYTGSSSDLEMAELIQLVEPSVVRIKVVDHRGNEGIGSGFFADKEGKIVTNYHVVENASKVTVETLDNKKLESIGFLIQDKAKDIAIIQVDPSEIKITPLAIATELPKKGDEVIAFGAPQGFTGSQTDGRVSSVRTGEEVSQALKELNPQIDVYHEQGFDIEMGWIQHTAAISGGNSGGPLVNLRGQLVGINTWTHPRGQNLNFASTMNEVVSVFSERDNMLKYYRPSLRDNASSASLEPRTN